MQITIIQYNVHYYLSNKFSDYELLSENISTMKKVYYGISLNTFIPYGAWHC